MLSDAKFFEGYSRWQQEENRYETWEEAVSRVMAMHKDFYKEKMTEELANLIEIAENAYKQKMVLGAQRALQFGGEQLLKHQMRLYNCTSSYADRIEFFGEFFYILLCGAGAGVSVQKHHVAKLPKIRKRDKQAKIHVIEDSIEGWATAADVLLSSFFVGGGKHPEYEGRRIYFDDTKIRPKGAEISGGFKAPGPEPLRITLKKITELIEKILEEGLTELHPIHVYDICMFIADSVLSGGVRRSATIFLFSEDDEEMMAAKTGYWFLKNPQRARSNISVVVVRDDAKREQFHSIVNNIKQFGEPGFYFTTNTEHCTNPCVEIGMLPSYEGKSGWQGCNLTEINGANCTSPEAFYSACIAASVLGTLQAGYTNFKFVNEVTKKIFEKESLIGVSVTGWMNNPEVLLDKEVLQEGARLVKVFNKKVSKLIGINPAARTTCVKPAGNASVLLKTASGVHGEHSPIYIRNVQMNKETEVAKILKKLNPYMVEESVSSTTDYVISFPIIAPKTSIYRKDLLGINLLEKVKLIQENWIEYGTNENLCNDPTVRHNVSNTISVPEESWEEVADYIFDNRYSFTGISLLSTSGDKTYNQAPNTEILLQEDIVSTYGAGAMFASGLIVDSFSGFNNLWEACSIAQLGEDPGDQERADLRANWIRRFKQYAKNYFNDDLVKAEHCLKAVHLLHKWYKIQQNFKSIDFSKELTKKVFTDIDTMGAQACAGGACEV